MEKQRTFSLGRIFLHDYAAFVAIFTIILSWGIYIAVIYFGSVTLPDRHFMWRPNQPIDADDALFFNNLGFIAILIGVPMLGWRIRFFQTLHKRGVEVTGYIYLEYVISKKRVEYKYTYQGVDYWGGNALTDSKYINNYNEGDEVILLVDPQKPKRAIIRDLYF